MIQVSLKTLALVAAAFPALAGCGPASQGSGPASPTQEEARAEKAYVLPPQVLSATRIAGGRIDLRGRAEAGATVRLAEPPPQTPILTRADAAGAWRATVPASATLRLYGLSMIEDQRIVQSEGYLAITPEGRAAQLRSGAGAWVIGAPARRLAILAVDYDRKGGASISGSGTPGASVGVNVDGIQRQAAIEADGRFVVPLNVLTAASHQIEAAEGANRVRASVEVSPPAPLTAGPFRAEKTALGWRIDWMTPGGGVQTTLILAAPEGSN